MLWQTAPVRAVPIEGDAWWEREDSNSRTAGCLTGCCESERLGVGGVRRFRAPGCATIPPDREAEGPLSSEIDALVDVFNKDREWVDRVLTYEQETEMRCRRAREEGIELGREEGAGAVGALMAALLDAGRIDDARRAAVDAVARDELARELGIAGVDG